MMHPREAPTDTQVIAAYLLNPEKRFMARVVAECAAEGGVTSEDILGPSKLAKYVWPRQVAMYLIRIKGHSYPEIGRFFGRDHTTVIHACRAVEGVLSKQPRKLEAAE